MEKEEPPISLKDGLVLLGIGAISIWLFIKGVRKRDEPDEKGSNP